MPNITRPDGHLKVRASYTKLICDVTRGTMLPTPGAVTVLACFLILIFPTNGSFSLIASHLQYEFGGGSSIPEAQPTITTTSSEAPEQRSQRHSSPPTRQPAPTTEAQTPMQEQDDSNSNTLKKRRPAPPPPMGRNPPTVASDEERLDQEGGSNTLRKRRAPAPPRPTSPPRRTQSLYVGSASDVTSERPPRPTSPPMRSGVSPDEGMMTFDTAGQEVAEIKQENAGLFELHRWRRLKSNLSLTALDTIGNY